MRTILTLTAAIAVAAPAFVDPTFVEAQSARSYGRGDICRQERREAGNKGTVTGAIVGGVLGAAVAGKGAKTEGAVLGGVVGAVAGHEIGKRRVKCETYPSRIKQTQYSRNNCQWVQEYYGNRDHSFEVCRGKDGVWRPSGRT